MYNTEKKEISKDVVLKGVIAGDRAFCGPELLQLDITNNCNTNCVGCWCHSDALGEDKLSGEKKHEQLSYEVIQGIVDDASEIGVKGIQLAGSGEPLMHPNIVEIIRYIKSKHLELEIVTNGILFTEEIVKALVECEVEQLAVSVWAGTPETYIRIHPNQSKATLGRIKNNLKLLFEAKSKRAYLPMVRMYHVISAYNYREIEAMVQFALESGVSRVEFQVVDIIPGKTEFLHLSKRHIKKIQKQFQKLKKKKEVFLIDKYGSVEFNEFGRMIIPDTEHTDFTFYFYNYVFYCCRCAMNYGPVVRVEENMDLGVVSFYFDSNLCEHCYRRADCSIDRPDYKITSFMLSIVGANTFLRRIENAENDKENYDKGLVSMPCYAGWDYARILTNGDVIPCCKGFKNPFGNIYKESFKTIWFSKTYNEFRIRGKTLQKDDPYFKPFGCLKGCDNYGRNGAIGERLRKFLGETTS
ncbi:radical SAM/SPASM domain-containing protein [Candidatus Omnitrophota bacterium]